MANYRKPRLLKRELGELDQQEKDYVENLANSLLKIQNSAPQKQPEKEETPPTDKRTVRSEQ